MGPAMGGPSEDTFSCNPEIGNDRSAFVLKCHFWEDGSPPNILDIRIGGENLAGLNDGSLPSELSQLTMLTNFEVAGNSLKGTIPTELARCKDMVKFDVSGNLLSGTLPEELAQEWSNLQYFDGSRNKLECEIPSSFAGLTDLSVFRVHQNAFVGQLPAISLENPMEEACTLFHDNIDQMALRLSDRPERNCFSCPLPPSLQALCVRDDETEPCDGNTAKRKYKDEACPTCKTEIQAAPVLELVGGVLGALALLASCALFFVFFMRKKREKERPTMRMSRTASRSGSRSTSRKNLHMAGNQYGAAVPANQSAGNVYGAAIAADATSSQYDSAAQYGAAGSQYLQAGQQYSTTSTSNTYQLRPGQEYGTAEQARPGGEGTQYMAPGAYGSAAGTQYLRPNEMYGTAES